MLTNELFRYTPLPEPAKSPRPSTPSTSLPLSSVSTPSKSSKSPVSEQPQGTYQWVVAKGVHGETIEFNIRYHSRFALQLLNIIPRDRDPEVVSIVDESPDVPTIKTQPQNHLPTSAAELPVKQEQRAATASNAAAANDTGNDSEIEVIPSHKALGPAQWSANRTVVKPEDRPATDSPRCVKRERSRGQDALDPNTSQGDGHSPDPASYEKKAKTPQEVAFEMEEAKILEECVPEEARARRDRKLAEARMWSGLVKSDQGT